MKTWRVKGIKERWMQAKELTGRKERTELVLYNFSEGFTADKNPTNGIFIMQINLLMVDFLAYLAPLQACFPGITSASQ